MPNRYVREDILDSERVDALSAEAEVFYRRLMSKADDYGRFHGEWRKLRAALYPLRVEKITEKLIERLLVEVSEVIEGRPLVRIYSHEGRRFLEITNFRQQIRSDSRFPNPNPVEISSDRTCKPDDRTCESEDSLCSEVHSAPYSVSSSPSSSNLSSPEEKRASESNGVQAEPGHAPLLLEAPNGAAGKPPPLEELLGHAAAAIHDAHPRPRRDIGKGQVRTRLREILRYKRLAGQESVAYLGELVDRHARMCQSDQWVKDGGEYAKGLNNWLAPTIERYDQDPPPPLPPGMVRSRGQPSRKEQGNRDFDELLLLDLKKKKNG